MQSYLSRLKTQLESPSSPGNRHFRILVRSQTTYGTQHTADCFLEVIAEHGCLTMVHNMKNHDGAASHVICQVVGRACVKKESLSTPGESTIHRSKTRDPGFPPEK